MMNAKQASSTPINSTAADTPNRVPAFVSTPISRFTAAQTGTSSKNSTPRESHTGNPFESYLLDRLHTNTYSPSIFARVVSPNDESSDNGEFRWSIDHIALLNPAEIDVNHVHHQVAPNRADHETEARYQAMVDKYFAESVIAPSPWSEGVDRSKQLPMTSSTSTSSPDIFRHEERDVSCQTMLTFPSDLDLTKILGGNFLFKENLEETCMSVETNLSGSTLRRKLFVCNTSNSAILVDDNQCTESLEVFDESKIKLNK